MAKTNYLASYDKKVKNIAVSLGNVEFWQIEKVIVRRTSLWLGVGTTLWQVAAGAEQLNKR